MHDEAGNVARGFARIALTFDQNMSTITLSDRFEVVIPEDIRRSLQLIPGEKLHVVPFAGRVELIPIRPIESMRGFLRGMDTSLERDEDRL
jgi:AbrB family looped-hinge helix DNA binding protein